MEVNNSDGQSLALLLFKIKTVIEGVRNYILTIVLLTFILSGRLLGAIVVLGIYLLCIVMGSVIKTILEQKSSH